MTSDLRVHKLSGAALEPWLEALGRLRIRVFREYPYLYDGSLEYEQEYLRTYVNSPNSLVVVVTDRQGEVVGATTCLPLRDEGPEFQQAFIQHGYDVNEVCYFGESILLPELRGQGLGKLFFTLREAHVKTLGMNWSAFCVVDRKPDHPLRPESYRSLDTFWCSQGYVRHPEMQATFVRKEINENNESPKTLTFWIKTWRE